MNGGIEFVKKNDGFDSNGVLDLNEKKKMGFERTVDQNLPKK